MSKKHNSFINWYSYTIPRFYIYAYTKYLQFIIICINPNDKNYTQMVKLLINNDNMTFITPKNYFYYYGITYKKDCSRSIPKSILRNIPDMAILLVRTFSKQKDIVYLVDEGYTLINYINKQEL